MSPSSSRWKAIVLVVMIAAAGLAAVALTRDPAGDVPRQLTIPERDCGLLGHFASLEDLKAHLKASPDGWPWIYRGDLLMGPGSSAAGSVPYSGTNNQVAGVDEADIVKTDGAFVYAATWNASAYAGEVAIVRAYPPETAGLVARIPVGTGVQGLFVDGTRLAVITGGGFAFVLRGGPVPGNWWYRPETRVLVYDLSTPSAPALVRNVTVTGSYVGARLIGDVAYLVVQDSLYLQDNGTTVVLPTIWTDGVPRDLTYADIGYFRDSRGSNADVTVLALSLTRGDPPAFESFLTRGVYQLYVSAKNVYMAGMEWESNPDRTVVTETSTVHEVGIDGGTVRYVCSARIPGSILNQFSMDESSGYLRVATTLGQWAPGGRATSAALYVFDDLLNPVGSLTGLAPGEQVYAARFLGGRAYLVTYRRVDPLFVLDVSNPFAPKVLGYLKIMGVSDYLHPYDATHLIGVGQADPAGTGRLHGVKLSLFDVEDVAHPAELANFTIGSGANEWAYSEAQYDHKAFLFIPTRGIISIPVALYRWDGTSGSYWQGAYVISVSPQHVFSLNGTITHSVSPDGTYYWNHQVRRSLYIGDVLYTVSGGLLLGNRLDTLAEVARVPL